MTQSLAPPTPPPPPAESKGKNCWLVGCSGCLIVLLVLFLGAIGGWLWLKSQFMVEPFEPIELTPTEETQMEAKLKAYNMIDDGGEISEDFEFPAEGIVLTEAELNYFISMHGDEMADSLRIDLEPNEISAELRVGESGSAKRWGFLGKVSVEQTESGLDVRLIDLKLGPFNLPKELLDEIATENLAEEVFAEDPAAREQFEQNVEKIEIQKDRILFIPKSQ